MHLRNLNLNLSNVIVNLKYSIWCRVLFWKKLLIIILIVVTLCLLVAAFVYIPKYLDEEQRVRDSSTSCKQYREFLQTAENWNNVGDTVQATGVYRLAVDLFRKGKCTKVH